MSNFLNKISDTYTNKCIDLYFELLKVSGFSVLDFKIQ